MERSRAYFDTSVIAKRYVPERAAKEARALLVRHDIVCSRLAAIELRSALRRRLANKEISDLDYDRAIRRVAEDRSYWELIEVGAAVLSRAEHLVSSRPVRTLDAVHVASALHVQESLQMPLAFVTADARQREAAEAAGLRVVWVA